MNKDISSNSSKNDITNQPPADKTPDKQCRQQRRESQIDSKKARETDHLRGFISKN